MDPADFTAELAAARRGEQWAWSRIYRRLAGPVTGYLSRRGAAEPQDVAAEVFLQIASGIDRFDGDWSSFKSWVFVIAHRRLIDERRRVSRRPPTIPVKEGHAVGGDVEEETLEVLSDDRVDELLDGLTDLQREVLLLRVVADLSLEEVAGVIGKKVGAVKALQWRALESIRRKISGSP